MKGPKPIDVCITVDTEFSIGGNFCDPEMAPIAKPIVLGAINGKEHGLGFILDSLAGFGIRATFFVEALQTAYFGDEPMRDMMCSCTSIPAGSITKPMANKVGMASPTIRARDEPMPN